LLVRYVLVDFNGECLSAFLRLKETLISVSTMQVPDCELLFEVRCDVSDSTMGVVPGKMKDKKPYAI